MLIPLKQIKPDPGQPRKTFKKETLQELKDSYEKLGLIQPITVRPFNGEYMIVIGERRYQASLLNEQEDIECIIRNDIDDKTAREMQFAENSQQENVPPLELGKAYYEHRLKYCLTQQQLGQIVGLSHTQINRLESLHTSLHPGCKDLVKNGKLDGRTATEISRLPNEIQYEMSQVAVNKNLSRDIVAKIVQLLLANSLYSVNEAMNAVLSGKANLDEIARVEAIKMASDVRLETPLEKELAAKALLKEARREAEEQLTPEDKAELESKKKAEKEERRIKTRQATKSLTPAVKSAVIEEAVENDPTLIRQAAKNIKRKKKELEQARLQMAKNGEAIPISDRWYVEVADINTYQTEQQFDFIITDPPYPKEYLPLYEILAKQAKEWLKPDGLLIAMCGQSYLDQIYNMLSKHLKYYWTASYLTPGQPTPLRQRQVNSTWKPILIYSPTDNYKGKIFGDVYTSDKPEKDNHDWGQSVSGMLSIINQICLPGQTIFDPFLGSGSTGIAALQHGCMFYGIDIDEQSVNVSKSRLAEVK